MTLGGDAPSVSPSATANGMRYRGIPDRGYCLAPGRHPVPKHNGRRIGLFNFISPTCGDVPPVGENKARRRGRETVRVETIDSRLRAPRAIVA